MSNSQNSRIIDFLGIPIGYQEIIDYLRQKFKLKEICQSILYQKIIKKTAFEQGIIVTRTEIRAASNRILKDKYLDLTFDVEDFLTEHLLTIEDWNTDLQENLLEQKLAELLFSHEIEKFFRQYQADFDQILLYQLVVPYEQLAHELFYQISEQEISLYEAAHLYDIDEKRRNYCGYEGNIYRCNLKPELADIVFNASIGELIGPVNSEQGSHLLMVEEFIPSELTTTIRQKILTQMFTQWLESKLDNMLQRSNPEFSE